jgi:hypothetical protein
MTSPAMIIISATSCLEGESDMDSGSTSTSTSPSGERRTYTCVASRLFPFDTECFSAKASAAMRSAKPMMKVVEVIAEHRDCI